MGKKKPKRVKTAPKAKKKAAAPPRKSAAKRKKASSAKPKRASKPRAATTKKKKKKATPSKPKRAPQARKPVAPKKAATPKKVSFSKALKDEISTALVTGARGCIGSFLIQQLLRDGYSVIAVDSKGPEIQALAGKNNLALRQGDLSDPRLPPPVWRGWTQSSIRASMRTASPFTAIRGRPPCLQLTGPSTGWQENNVSSVSS